jgi:Leucine-rich repeat (LRR) protein
MVAILDWFPHKQQAAHMRLVSRAWRDAFNNSVRCISIHSNLRLLPHSTSYFPGLNHLCVSHTNAEAAVAAVRLLGMPSRAKLVTLEIGNTVMPGAPTQLHQLTALRALSLTSCKLRELARCRLHLLPGLQSLDLSANQLEGEGVLCVCVSGGSGGVLSVCAL